MRIRGTTKDGLGVTPSIYVPVLEKQRSHEVHHKQNLSPDGIKGHARLKEQILAIQRSKVQLGIENLAAASLDSWMDGSRMQAAKELAESPSWDNFQRLRIALSRESEAATGGDHTCLVFTSAMAKILQQLDPSQITDIYHFEKTTFRRFSESLLMDIASGNRIRFGHFPVIEWVSSQSRIIAAETLYFIVLKVGERLDDEAIIIKKLLSSSIGDIRGIAAESALDTYRHKWRKKIEDTGLIAALRKEEDDEIRVKVAKAIAYANPKAILEEYSVSGSKGKFCPASRITGDKSPQVREHLLSGLYDLALAQYKRGGYYTNFNEIPALSLQNRTDCFDYALRVLERFNATDVDWTSIPLFQYACVIASISLSDDSKALAKSSGRSQEYERVVTRLVKLDLVNLIRNLSKLGCSIGGGIFFGGDADNVKLFTIVDEILLSKVSTEDKPLLHYCNAKNNIPQAVDRNDCYFLVGTAERFDIAVERYLVNTSPEKIRWGTHQEFNLTVKDLLDLLERSQKDSCKVVILDLLAKLNQEGVRLEETEDVSLLEEALSDENKVKLKNVLRRTVSLQLGALAKDQNKIANVSSIYDLISNPQGDMPPGKALILYRSLRDIESFKDYYGMHDFKNQVLRYSSQRLAGSGPVLGYLLSGDIGTGKSFLGKVLANELALPCLELVGSKVEKSQSGQMWYEYQGSKYTLAEYFDIVKQNSPCVLLIDELEEIANPEEYAHASILHTTLNQLLADNTPVVVIGTTNHPKTARIKGLKIDEEGRSGEIDQVLSRSIHPDLFSLLQPCYLFHQRSVGYHFTRDYLGYLLTDGKIQGEVNVELFSKLAQGLAPADIAASISSIKELPIPCERLTHEIKELKREVDENLEARENLIETKIEDLVAGETHSLEGNIDYTELAIIAEDLSNREILEVLNSAPATLTQSNLLKLFIAATEKSK